MTCILQLTKDTLTRFGSREDSYISSISTGGNFRLLDPVISPGFNSSMACWRRDEYVRMEVVVTL